MTTAVHCPVIICACGHTCTTRWRRTTSYTIWVNYARIEGRYRRTCEKCDTPAKRQQLESDGFEPLKQFLSE